MPEVPPLLEQILALKDRAGRYAKKAYKKGQIPSAEELKYGLKESAKSIVQNPLRALYGVGNIPLEIAKERIRKNVTPFDYQNVQYDPESGVYRDFGPVERTFNAAILNKKEADREAIERGTEDAASKERVDLTNMVFRKPQQYGTIAPAQYRPTQSKDEDAQYYRVNRLESDIRSRFPEIKAKDIDEFRNKLYSEIRSGSTPFGNVTYEGDPTDPYNSYNEQQARAGKPVKGKYIQSSTQPLGVSTTTVGEDDKGYYVSYYDPWDLSPWSGFNEGAGELMKSLGLGKQNILNDAIGISTPEIYGRVYFDKKTGKVMRDKDEVPVPARIPTGNVSLPSKSLMNFVMPSSFRDKLQSESEKQKMVEKKVKKNK